MTARLRLFFVCLLAVALLVMTTEVKEDVKQEPKGPCEGIGTPCGNTSCCSAGDTCCDQNDCCTASQVCLNGVCSYS
ncbi:hypothetical protein L596_010674 [Steinernema carpocapsae]|uniref:Granulins domain-containing protein n=1 Tax=Steinernema carpocapsae TaxID=34508 RepID=A0A4U5PJR8_STECR|nr:hypothetical protein L596_010674 [Steinernema carpocapsae]